VRKSPRIGRPAADTRNRKETMNKNRLKIVLLGGGSLYFESVIGELAVTPELDGAAIELYDINARRMELMRRVGRRVVEKTGTRFTVTSTRSLAQALDGADYAIASIGVHGPDAAWHKADTDAVARLGVIQTTGDTVGPSGLSQGLRIVPIFVDIARQMERYCPGAVLLNHSNPMSVICRAVTKHTRIRTIGYCHNVAGSLYYFARVLGCKPEELDVTVAGPNHCVWLLGITLRGRDVYPELKRRILARPPEPTKAFSRECLELFDLFPIGGDRHIIEFFPHARRAARTKKIHYGLQWRSDMIRENRLKREISKEPDALALKAAGKKDVYIPTTLSPEAMGQQVRALAYGPEKIHVVNIPNRGAVPGLPGWAVLELKAIVGPNGVRPVFVGDLPPQAARWSAAQIYAHELTVEAAVEGSRRKALMALACDPMIRDFAEARRVLDALVKAQGPRLKAFRA
jgi:alpha-galactosidase